MFQESRVKFPTDQFLVEPHAHALGWIKVNDDEIGPTA